METTSRFDPIETPNPILFPSEWCNTKEACEILGITRSGLMQARGRNKVRFEVVGRTILWLKSSVIHYRDTRGTFPIYTPGAKENGTS